MTFLHLNITPAPAENSSGVLIPKAQPCLPLAAHAHLPRYHYSFLKKDQEQDCTPLPISGRWIVYLPALFSLFAADMAETIPNITELVMDKAWRNNRPRLLWWRLRLFHEQFRLGSDAQSPAFRCLLHRSGLAAHLPCHTIGMWRQALAANKALEPLSLTYREQ